MKKTLAFIVSGSLLVGSAAYAFAYDGINEEKEVEAHGIVVIVEEENDLQVSDMGALKELLGVEEISDEEIIEIFRDILKELAEKAIDETLETMPAEKLIALFQNTLKELEATDGQTDEKEEGEKSEDTKENIDSNEADKKGTEDPEADSDKDEVLNSLYRKIAHFEALYERLPDAAKPAIRKNIRKTELKAFLHKIQTGQATIESINAEELDVLQENLDELQQELLNKDLTEDAKKSLEESIANLEAEINKAVENNTLQELFEGNANPAKELRKEIQKEFLEEKKQQIQGHKEEKEVTRTDRKETKSNNGTSENPRNNDNGNNGNTGNNGRGKSNS